MHTAWLDRVPTPKMRLILICKVLDALFSPYLLQSVLLSHTEGYRVNKCTSPRILNPTKYHEMKFISQHPVKRDVITKLCGSGDRFDVSFICVLCQFDMCK